MDIPYEMIYNHAKVADIGNEDIRKNGNIKEKDRYIWYTITKIFGQVVDYMELVRYGLSGVFMINYLILLTYTFIDKLPEDYIRIIGYICVGLLIVFIRFIVFIKLKLKGGFGLLNFEIFFMDIYIFLCCRYKFNYI